MDQDCLSPLATSVLEQLARATDDLASARNDIDADAVAALTAIARAADALHVAALGMLDRARRRGGVERTTGLPVEMVLRADARVMGWDARALAGASDMLRRMPRLTDALARDAVSWSQARAILIELRRLDPATVRAADGAIGAHADRLGDADPEALLDVVQDVIFSARPDLAVRREDGAIESSFLALQARLDGSGGRLFGEADAERFATIAGALDAAADRPVNADHLHAPSRAAQRMDALVSICEASVSGATGGAQRSRPRLLVTTDLPALQDLGASEAARVLWAIAGGPGRITPLAARVLACDAEITPVVFKDGQPIGVGDTRSTVPAKIRTALIARDGGCRFPGCRAPASWTDAHHIFSPIGGGDASMENLLLLCRRCHRRVHRYRWRIRMLPDGATEFRHRGRRLVSHARGRPPPRM